MTVCSWNGRAFLVVKSRLSKAERNYDVILPLNCVVELVTWQIDRTQIVRLCHLVFAPRISYLSVRVCAQKWLIGPTACCFSVIWECSELCFAISLRFCWPSIGPLPIYSRPWPNISMDITEVLVSLASTRVLTLVYRFSKMTGFIALPKLPSAMELSKILINHVFRVYGFASDTCFRLEAPVRVTFLKGVLQNHWSHSEPGMYNLQSRVKWSDWTPQPAVGNRPLVPCVPKSLNMEQTPDQGRVCPHLVVHLPYRLLAIQIMLW